MSRASVSIPGLDVRDHAIAMQLWIWTGIPENRAKCLNRDLMRLPRLLYPEGIYLHRSRPCRLVETVGIVVGSNLRSWDNSVEYLVDDGTEVISVIPIKVQAADALAKVKQERTARIKSIAQSPSPSNPFSEGIPEEYRPRIPQSVKDKQSAALLKEKYAMQEEQLEIQLGALVEVGELIRVIGKLGFQRWAPDENIVVDAEIETLTDRNEESLHILRAVELAETTYSERFILPDLPVAHALPGRRSRLGQSGLLYNELHSNDQEESEGEREETDRGKACKPFEDDGEASKVASTRLQFRKQLFGDDDNEEDDSHTEDEDEDQRPQLKSVKHCNEPLVCRTKLRKAIIPEDESDEIQSCSEVQSKQGIESETRESELSRHKLRRALLGIESEEEEVQVPENSVKSHKSSLNFRKSRESALSRNQLRKALLGDDESETEDEENGDFQSKVTDRRTILRRSKEKFHRPSSPNRDLATKILAGNGGESDNEVELHQLNSFKPQKKVHLRDRDKSSSLYKTLHGEVGVDSNASALQDTPKASTSKSKFNPITQIQNEFPNRNPFSTSSNTKPAPRDIKSRPSISSSRSIPDVEYVSASSGLKKKRDDSGVGGVGSDSSNLKRESKADEASSKKRRVTSKVSEAPPASSKSQSVKDWSKLRPSQQTVDTFRFYVRMHVNNYCRASQTRRSTKREASPSSGQEARKRQASQSTNLDTPKASLSSFKGKARDLSGSMLCPDSDSEEDLASRDSIRLEESGNRHLSHPPPFTLAYLMRVKDLRNHAREIVKVNHKKEERNRQSSAADTSKRDFKPLSDFELEVTVSRLFGDALREMMADGSLVPADHTAVSFWPFNGTRNLEMPESEDEDARPTKFERSILSQNHSSPQQTSSPSSRSVSSASSTPSRDRRSSRATVSNRPDHYLESSEELKARNGRRTVVEDDPFETPKRTRTTHSQHRSRRESSSTSTATATASTNLNQLPIFKRQPAYYQLVSSTLLKDPISEILQSRKRQSTTNSSTAGSSLASLVERLKQSDMRWENLSDDKIKECLERLKHKRLVKEENRLWEWIGR